MNKIEQNVKKTRILKNSREKILKKDFEKILKKI